LRIRIIENPFIVKPPFLQQNTLNRQKNFSSPPAMCPTGGGAAWLGWKRFYWLDIDRINSRCLLSVGLTTMATVRVCLPLDQMAV